MKTPACKNFDGSREANFENLTKPKMKLAEEKRNANFRERKIWKIPP
jgi:hypothetical protein